MHCFDPETCTLDWVLLWSLVLEMLLSGAWKETDFCVPLKNALWKLFQETCVTGTQKENQDWLMKKSNKWSTSLKTTQDINSRFLFLCNFYVELLRTWRIGRRIWPNSLTRKSQETFFFVAFGEMVIDADFGVLRTSAPHAVFKAQWQKLPSLSAHLVLSVSALQSRSVVSAAKSHNARRARVDARHLWLRRKRRPPVQRAGGGGEGG